MTDLEREKKAAARVAVAEAADGMLVGLGTGSTAAYAVRELGHRVKQGLRIQAVATSSSTEALAQAVGIPLLPFQDVSAVDLTIDGADEIDGLLRAIKGGGGALMREKIVAAASKRMVIIVDSSKSVERLGHFRLPVEVLPFAARWVESALTRAQLDPRRRVRADGTDFLTDQGNLIFDLGTGLLDDPPRLAAALDDIPGILEHGLFLTEAHAARIGRADRVDTIERP